MAVELGGTEMSFAAEFGRTEMPLAGGLAVEQNKGLSVVSVAEKRCYWLASRHSERTETPLAGGLAVEILLASELTFGQNRDAIGWYVICRRV